MNARGETRNTIPSAQLSESERECLVRRFHEAAPGQCIHANPAACEAWADWIEPAILGILTRRRERGCTHDWHGYGEWRECILCGRLEDR